MKEAAASGNSGSLFKLKSGSSGRRKSVSEIVYGINGNLIHGRNKVWTVALSSSKISLADRMSAPVAADP